MKPFIVAISALVLLPYSAVGVIESSKAHGGSEVWLISGILLVGIAIGNILSYATFLPSSNPK